MTEREESEMTNAEREKLIEQIRKQHPWNKFEKRHCDKWEVMACKVCDGWGYFHEDQVTCDACDGTGLQRLEKPLIIKAKKANYVKNTINSYYVVQRIKVWGIPYEMKEVAKGLKGKWNAKEKCWEFKNPLEFRIFCKGVGIKIKWVK